MFKSFLKNTFSEMKTDYDRYNREVVLTFL